jgi:hypothetical protein
LTPVLAVVGTWILVNQYRLEKLRWKVSLYDKRYPVFLSTMQFISAVVQKHDVSNEELNKFLRDSKDREFLFGDDVKEHLDKLYKSGLELNTIEKILEGLPVGEERHKRVERSSEIAGWFAQQFDVSKEIFGKYLRVDKK